MVKNNNVYKLTNYINKMVEHLINFDPEIKKQRVVQVNIKDELVTAFEDFDGTSHNRMLENLLTKEGINFNLVVSPNSLDVPGLGPAIKGEDYEIVGAGAVFKGRDVYLFTGKSTFYGIPINKERAKELTELTDYNFK